VKLKTAVGIQINKGASQIKPKIKRRRGKKIKWKRRMKIRKVCQCQLPLEFVSH